jgi:hypothetical protein
MIKEVLKNLNLEVSYYSKGQSIPNTFKFTFTDIYKETPFIVIINEFHVQPVYTFFNIKILNDIEFIIESENKDVWLYNFEDDYSLAKIPSLYLCLIT